MFMFLNVVKSVVVSMQIFLDENRFTAEFQSIRNSCGGSRASITCSSFVPGEFILYLVLALLQDRNHWNLEGKT